MTLAERLESEMKDAMRAGEKLRLGVIRRARAAIKNAEIDAGGPLDDTSVEKVLKGLAKQHRESIDQFRAGNREDLATQEEAELAVLGDYLPEALDEATVEAAVREIIAEEGATSPKDMGNVIKAAVGRLGTAADGRMVSEIAKRLLAG